MRWPFILLVLSFAIIEECSSSKTANVSKSNLSTKEKTTIKQVKTAPSKASQVVKKPKSNSKPPATSKDAKVSTIKGTVKKIKTKSAGKKPVIHVHILADTSLSKDNGTTNTNSSKSTNSTYSKVVDNTPKDYTIAGGYKIFKYEDDHFKKGDCPPYWHKYDGNCYLFSRDRLNWYLASMKCFSLGGFLATVESSHENTYIINQLKAYKIIRGAWMGLNTVLYPAKHNWYWGFSGKQNLGFDWFGYEPVYKKTGDNLCAIFWKTYHFHWHVESCSQRNYYICKIKLKETCSCTF